MLEAVFAIVIIALLIGALPAWPHSRGWGYGPSGIIGALLLIMLLMVVVGRI